MRPQAGPVGEGFVRSRGGLSTEEQATSCLRHFAEDTSLDGNYKRSKSARPEPAEVVIRAIFCQV